MPLSDKAKEWREWGTFWLSGLAVLVIPVGALILKNQRLEMEQGFASNYVTKQTFENQKLAVEKTFESEKQEVNKQVQETWKKLGETNGKLDSVLIQQAQMSTILQDLREAVKDRGTR